MFTLQATFIPHTEASKSLDDLNLKWQVTLLHNDKPLITTDYTQGIGHAPAYNAPNLGTRYSIMRHAALRYEAQNGQHHVTRKPLPAPSLLDVLYALHTDADALNCSGFEDWCSELGFNSDSIKHQAIYNACLSTALKLRPYLPEIETFLTDHDYL